METRRFILALSLSLLVFVAYLKFFAPTPPEQPTAPQPAAETAQRQPQTAPQPGRAVSFPKTAKGRDIIIETDLVKAVFNTAGGVIKRWELKKYREADTAETGFLVTMKRLFGGAKKEEKPKKEFGNVQLVPLYDASASGDVIPPLLITPLEKRLAPVVAAEYRASHEKIVLGADREKQTLSLTYTGPGGVVIEKRFTFHRNDYKVDLEITTKGIDGYTLSLGTDFGFADKVSSDAAGRVGFVSLVDGKSVVEKLDDIKGETQRSGMIEWLGQEDKYFTAALVFGRQGIVTVRKTAGTPATGDLLNTDLLVKERPGALSASLFAGPKSYPLLQSYGKGMESMVDYGWFGILAKPMFWLLQFFYTIFKNYGIAIILLTIVVRILLFYPSLKSARSMEEMKTLQPLMAAIKEKYKKDPQRMNQEMMNLYKEKKVNPLGGCLPMLLQLPFFVALYNVLSVSIELRQSPFISFWIKDLSVHDPYYILPVLMGVSMIFTMKMTSTTVDPQQQKMMMFMNVAFIFLFAWLPAGLLLYITLSNVLSIVQQLYVRKIIAGTAA